MSTHVAQAAERAFARALPRWWIFILTGIAWELVAVIVLRFDYGSVSAIAALFGVIAIAAGLLEVAMAMISSGWRRLLSAVLAVAFVATGVISFIHPGDTFEALAAVVSFFLIFAGTFDIINAISVRKQIEVWWLQLISGIIELALGFWAAGYYGRSAVLLVAWVAAIGVTRGVRDIVTGFRLHELQKGDSF